MNGPRINKIILWILLSSLRIFSVICLFRALPYSLPILSISHLCPSLLRKEPLPFIFRKGLMIEMFLLHHTAYDMAVLHSHLRWLSPPRLGCSPLTLFIAYRYLAQPKSRKARIGFSPVRYFREENGSYAFMKKRSEKQQLFGDPLCN